MFSREKVNRAEQEEFRYRDRQDAGRVLAEFVEDWREKKPVVLALPRGGVPVAYEVAKHLGAPLDVFLVRKVGVPEQPELAMGAIASGGVLVLNEAVLAEAAVNREDFEAVARREQRELERREEVYRAGRNTPPVEGRAVILVDDGIATGASMRAAVKALRQRGPSEIMVAVPVAAPSFLRWLRKEVEEVRCPLAPDPFYAVGAWYGDFRQTTDEEVIGLLREAQTA